MRVPFPAIDRERHAAGGGLVVHHGRIGLLLHVFGAGGKGLTNFLALSYHYKNFLLTPYLHNEREPIDHVF